MTDIPLPAPGDQEWSDWGAEEETLSDLARSLGAVITPDVANGRVGLAGNTSPAVPIDIGVGDNAVGYTTTSIMQMFRGTAASPITTAGNHIRLTKRENLSAAEMDNNPAGNDRTAPLAVYNRGASTSYPQVAAAWFVAEGGGVALGNDVCAVQGIGIGLHDGPYHAMGGYFTGRKQFTQTLASGVEVSPVNNSGVDDTITAPVTGLSKSTGIWLAARGANRVASAIQVGTAGGGAGFDNGIVFGTNATLRSSIADYSSAPTSISIQGTHATAAIQVAAGSGHVGFGVTAGVNTQLFVQSDADTVTPIIARGFSATQAAVLLSVQKSDASYVFQVNAGGAILVAEASNVTLGTTTGTKLGTATTQKLGFWNATPVVQPTAVANATDAATVITQLNALLTRLRTVGLIAA